MIHLEAFLLSKRSERTRAHYRSILYSYLDYCKAIPIEPISADSVVNYISSLSGISPSTIDNKAACLKSYFRYLDESGLVSGVKLKHRLPKRNQGNTKQTQGMTDSEANAVLSAITEPMHRTLFSIMLYTGIRISEVQSIRISDVHNNNGFMTVQIFGKGGKYRTLPLQKTVAELVDDLLSRARSRRASENSPLFTVDGINPIHKNTIRKWLKKYLLEAGVHKNISPHGLRVTAITQALQQNCNPIYVQYMGGWTSMEMVLRYDRNRQNLQNSPALQINYERKVK